MTQCEICLTPCVSPCVRPRNAHLVLHNWRCENENCQQPLKIQEEILEVLKCFQLQRIGTLCIGYSLYDGCDSYQLIVAEFESTSGILGMTFRS